VVGNWRFTCELLTLLVGDLAVIHCRLSQDLPDIPLIVILPSLNISLACPSVIKFCGVKGFQLDETSNSDTARSYMDHAVAEWVRAMCRPRHPLLWLLCSGLRHPALSLRGTPSNLPLRVTIYPITLI
jgi:hypothetical protein